MEILLQPCVIQKQNSAKIAQHLTEDLEKNTVNYRNNYDETEKEPEVLPSQYPNILVNGAGGIAVGMATSIPPHNLGEVIMEQSLILKIKILLLVN